MVFGRGRRGFKRRKTGGFKRRRVGGRIGKLARAIRNLRKGIETKINDFTIGTTLVSNAGFVTSLFFPVQGITLNTRIGSRVSLKSIILNFEVFGIDSTNLFRVLLMMYKKPEAIGTPAITSVLDMPGGAEVLSHRSWNSRKSYRTIRDWWINTNQVAKPSVVIHKKVKIPRRYSDVVFQGNNGLPTDVMENLLFLVVVTDSAAIPTPSILVHGRCTFQDM